MTILKMIFDPNVEGVAHSLKHSFREMSPSFCYTFTSPFKLQWPDTVQVDIPPSLESHIKSWLDDYNKRVVSGYRVQILWQAPRNG